MDWGCEVGQVVLSKPKVLQEPREEARHPGFNQLSQLLSGLSKGNGGEGAGGNVATGGMNAILQQLAPQLAPQLASASKTAPPALTAGATADVEAGVAESLKVDAPPSSKPPNQIEELAHLFLGVLSGVLTEKLVRSVNHTYEVTLENLDGVGGDQLQFYLDLKQGLGEGEDCFKSYSFSSSVSQSFNHELNF